jgi:DNA-directed RNA polymerase specialized sigma24 family protein
MEPRVEITHGEPLGGEGEAFEGFFDRLLPRAVSLAAGLLNDRAAAEDAAVEALARAYVDWDRVRTLTYRDAWVLRVTANVAYDQVRKAGRDRRPLPPPAPAPDSMDTSTLRVTLVPALRKLSRRQRRPSCSPTSSVSPTRRWRSSSAAPPAPSRFTFTEGSPA